MKRTNILFADDMPECFYKFMDGLLWTGFSKGCVYWAKTRDEALMRLEENKYDLVITDFELGNEAPTGGLDVIKEAYKKGFPVLSISSANHRKEVEELGLCKFIFKKEFFNNIERVISDILGKL